jgi:hypothetical protein
MYGLKKRVLHIAGAYSIACCVLRKKCHSSTCLCSMLMLAALVVRVGAAGADIQLLITPLLF